MKHIVIIGGGYAGMAAATRLARRVKGRDDARLTLVNPQTRFTERLRLHEAAFARIIACLFDDESVSIYESALVRSAG